MNKDVSSYNQLVNIEANQDMDKVYDNFWYPSMFKTIKTYFFDLAYTQDLRRD